MAIVIELVELEIVAVVIGVLAGEIVDIAVVIGVLAGKIVDIAVVIGVLAVLREKYHIKRIS